jgi:hypothetical protein
MSSASLEVVFFLQVLRKIENPKFARAFNMYCGAQQKLNNNNLKVQKECLEFLRETFPGSLLAREGPYRPSNFLKITVMPLFHRLDLGHRK